MDEGSSVVGFLDDCVQRCLKTPYRYLEERNALIRYAFKNVANEENTLLSDYQEVGCSPLLITVLDQLEAKVANNLLTPSDILAITSFIRKLVFNLSSKQHDLNFLSAFIDKVDALVHPGLFPQYPNITTAIRREIPILWSCLRHLQNPPVSSPTSPSTVVEEFLDRINQVPIRQCPSILLVRYPPPNACRVSCIYPCTCYFSV
jgi:nucleolar pre-ribosomal-associated protein 1